jgi:hypothetical protein
VPFASIARRLSHSRRVTFGARRYFLNRSAAHFALGKLEAAVEDAERAIALNKDEVGPSCPQHPAPPQEDFFFDLLSV